MAAPFLSRAATAISGNGGAWIAFAIASCITLAAWDGTEKHVATEARQQFESRKQEIAFNLARRLEAYEQVLRGSAGLLAATDIDRGKWQRYYAGLRLDQHLPGVQGLGYVQLVSHRDKEDHIRKMRTEGFPDYAIAPAGHRDVYAAIVLLEPSEISGRRGLGYDANSEPQRRAAMERARDNAAIAISGKVFLEAGESASRPAFLMYLPVYGSGADVATVAQRRAAIHGYVFIRFHVDALMEGVLDRNNLDVSVALYDGEETDASRLYSSDHAFGLAPGATPLMSSTTAINAHGRPWLLRVASRQPFEIMIDSGRSRLVLVTGLVLSMLLFVVLRALTASRDHAHAIAQDMTRELRQTTLVQRAILDSANYSIVSTDERGIIRTFNRAAERMLGYTAVEVVGKATLAVIHDPQEIAQRAKALTAELGRVIEPGFEVFVAKTRSGTPDETEWTCVRKDGLRFPLLLSVTALHDGQDNLTGFLAIGYDMTERKAMERLKNEFISTVSHELRTPLTSIMGSLGLLTSGIGGSLPDQASSLIEIARKNAARLVRLINDILDIDKIESGKMRFDLREHELMPLVSQAIEANRDYARQFGVDFVIERALPLARVKVDSDRLAQVFTNLLSNAAKFSPRGTKVAIAVERTDGCIRISVTDSGAGIPPEFESKIFQKFCQADSSDTRQKDGSGLGLSITKAIVEHSGGRIGFRSRPGAGTTFIVDLPEVSPSVAAPVAAAPHQHTDRPRVLICEDDHDIARLLQLMLEGAGYVADISHDAERAKRMLAQNAYAALTLDIALPGQDGIGLIRELRATATTRDLPIVVVSAHAERGRQTLQGSGIVIIDWLDKPIDQQRLLAAFGRTLKRGTLRPRILHVEDDPDISQIVATLVSPHYEMECAPTLAAARNALQRDHYDLVILDMELPDGSGSELLPLVHTLSKPTPVLVFSANETPCNLPDMIAASLVKSQTTNDRLLQTILHILPPAAAENESLFAATA